MKILINIIDKIINAVSWVCVAALLLMVANVFVDVFVRYFLVDFLKSIHLFDWYDTHLSWLGGIGMQELEWHWFSIVFLFGLSYTLKENGHVRVDVFYDKFSRRTQAIINIVGGLIFALPFSFLILDFTWEFFVESFNNMENRGDPGSLPRLWPVKLLLPLSFLFLILSLISVILKEILVLKGDINEGEAQ